MRNDIEKRSNKLHNNIGHNHMNSGTSLSGLKHKFYHLLAVQSWFGICIIRIKMVPTSQC